MSVVQNNSQKSKWYLPGILTGLGITFKHLVVNLFNKKQMITLNYPEQKYEYSPRFKGNHILHNKRNMNTDY